MVTSVYQCFQDITISTITCLDSPQVDVVDPHEKAQSNWKECGCCGAPAWDLNPHKLFQPDLSFAHPQMIFNGCYRDWGSLRNNYPNAWTPSQKTEIEGWM